MPFLLTFVAGLFIASFFVKIAAPFSGFSRGERRFGNVRMLRMENQRLETENQRLRDRVDQLEQQQGVPSATNPDTVEPWEDVPPPAPPAPRHPERMKVLQ